MTRYAALWIAGHSTAPGEGSGAGMSGRDAEIVRRLRERSRDGRFDERSDDELRLRQRGAALHLWSFPSRLI